MKKKLWYLSFCLLLASPVGAVTPMDYYNTLVAGGSNYGYRDGNFVEARFNAPAGLAFDETGHKLYVADSSNQRIRVVDLSNNNDVSTLAGTGAAGIVDGPFNTATFNQPLFLAYIPGDKLAVYDSGNSAIRLLDLKAGTVSTLAKNATATSLVYFSKDKTLYFSDPQAGTVERVDPQTGDRELALSKNKQVPAPKVLGVSADKLYVVDKDLAGVYEVSFSKNGSDKTVKADLNEVGVADKVLGLAWSDGVLYALCDSTVPLMRIAMPKSQPVSLATMWGFTIDPNTQTGFEPLILPGAPQHYGFVASPNEPKKLYISGVNLVRNALVSVKDYDFNDYWKSSSEPSGMANDFLYPEKKPENTYRILLAGDSRTYIAPEQDSQVPEELDWFYGAPRTDTMGKQLEVFLNMEASLRGSKTHFEVLEWNRKGQALSTYADYELPPLVKKYKIDMVLAMTGHTGFMDYYMNPMTKEGVPGLAVDTEYLLKPLSERQGTGAAQRIYQRFKKKSKNKDINKLSYPGADSPWGFSVFEDPEMKDDLIELAGRRLELLTEKMDALKAPGYSPRLVLFYVPFRVWSDYMESFWADLSTHYQWPYLDLTDSYDALKVAYFPNETHCCDGHYTAYSSRLIGYLLAHDLIEKKLVPAEKAK